MSTDPLSVLLSLIEARAVYAGGLAAGGDWAVRFPPPEKIKFFTMARGSCWIAIDGSAAPVRLEAGDVILLSSPVPFAIASDLALAPGDARTLFDGIGTQLAVAGTGGDALFLGCHLDLDANGGRLLVDSLPATIHLRAQDTGAGQLQWLIQELVREINAPTPGTDVARAGLVQMMFLQILRGHLAQERGMEVGWLRAACDPRLAPALGLMHADPARDWRLPELADAAAMSRTAFATRFKAVAGIAPLRYLTEWRMRLAERKLRDGRQSVAAVAEAVGYGSEAAFSTAFKRVMGRPPRRPPIRQPASPHAS